MIHEARSASSFTFQHIALQLTQGMFLLQLPGRETLDDKTVNFTYGQFEIFIPVRELELPDSTSPSNYIVHMPQTSTLSSSGQATIKTKQALYHAIVATHKGNRPAVEVVIAIGYVHNGRIYKIGHCNLFFQSLPRYLFDYTGNLKSKP